MILIIIAISLIISLILIITTPKIIVYYLKTIFETVQMNLYSPISLRAILINGKIGSWGLENLTVFISAIELGWSPNSFKLRLKISNLHIYLSRRITTLCSVNLINGNQEANILYNFVNMLFKDFVESQEAKRLNNSGVKIEQQVKKSSSYFVEGILHIFIIFLMNIFEVIFTDTKLFVISGYPQGTLNFTTEKQRKKSLIKMQYLSQYCISCSQITVQSKAQEAKKYKLLFKTNSIEADSFSSNQSQFIVLNRAELDCIVPFSMSIQKSFNEMKLFFRIDRAAVKIKVADFDHFFEFIKQSIFKLQRKTKIIAAPSSQISVNIQIGNIKLILNEIYQQQYDNQQTQKYLSNVNEATLQLIQFSLGQQNYSVKQTNLSISKFSKGIKSETQIQILKIMNLVITNKSSGELVQIQHDDVLIHCESEQIAFFGKIFHLFNERVSFQNYNQEIYRCLMDSYNQNGTIISEIQRMIQKMNSLQEAESEYLSDKDVQQKKVVYNPKRLTFLLKMKNLSHTINIEGFTYNRYRNINEMSHQITINKISVDYEDIKQFLISDFKLTFSQTIAQKQLSMAIQSITMQQNEQTLRDYLDSFTLFKHLLQFQSDQQQKPTKLLKKYIYLGLISVQFEKQIINLKSLKIDKQSNRNQALNSLYFSVQRCEVLLTKVLRKKKKSKQSANSTHILFSIDSLSVRVDFQERNNKIKPIACIIIKNPTLNIPQKDISSIILSYIKIFLNLQSHIEAFLINVTNEKLKALKYQIKQFYKQPDRLTLIITDTKLCICDSYMERHILSFSKTVREYFAEEPRYNQAELLSIMKRNSQIVSSLVNVKISKIKLEISPIEGIIPTENSVLQWVQKFEEQNKEQRRNNANQRCRKVQTYFFQLKIKDLQMNIRDYPAPILQLNYIKTKGQLLRLKKILGQKLYYIKSNLDFGQLIINIGLGQLSGWQMINQRINQFRVIGDNFRKQIKRAKYQLTIWHKIMQQWRWRVQISNQSKWVMNLLTGDNPYCDEKFIFSLNKMRGLSTTKEIKLNLIDLQAFLKQFRILRLPILETTVQIKGKQTDFDVFFSAHIREETCYIRLASWIVQYVSQLGQLRKDWLLLYGIYEKQLQKSNLQLEDIENMTYLQIVNLIAQQKMSENNSNSILNYLRRVQCKFYVSKLSIGVIQDDLQFSLQAQQVQTFTLLQADHDLYNQLKVHRSKIDALSLKLTFTKLCQNHQTIRETQLNHNTIEGDKTQIGKTYQFVKCSNLVINFNWYFQQKERVGLANQWIHADNIVAEVSKRMQRYSEKIIKNFKFQRKIKEQKQGPTYQQPINKFRKIVLKIIQINRRKKILEGRIKKYNVVVSIENYQLILKSSQKSLILQSQEKALLLQKIQYGEHDKYHSKPCKNLIVLFPSSRVRICNKTDSFEQSIVLMTAGQLKLQIETSDEKLDQGKCYFENVQIQIDEQGKNILQDLVNFMVQMVNTNEHRREIYNIQTAKYEQLINNGRKRLKQKIQWRQSDLKWKQRQFFNWQFILRDLYVTVSLADEKLISLNIKKTQILLKLFDNLKIQRKIILRSLTLVNDLQTLSSDYRHILQLGKDQTVGFAIIDDTYQVTAYTDISWLYHKQLSFWIEPIRLKLTEELVTKLMKLIGNPDMRNDLPEYDELREYINKTPNYFKLLCIEPITLQVWFRSENIFKRLDGIKLTLSKYELKEKLYTKDEILRTFLFWLFKQVGSQIFSLIGQKMFGDNDQEIFG